MHQMHQHLNVECPITNLRRGFMGRGCTPVHLHWNDLFPAGFRSGTYPTRQFLTFHGVDSAFYTWLNGVFVGFSKDSRLPAEFDVTDHLQDGSNLLAVQVGKEAVLSQLKVLQGSWQCITQTTQLLLHSMLSG